MKVKKQKTNKIKGLYPIYSFRLNKETYELLLKTHLKSGLSYNLLFKKMIELYDNEENK